MAIVAGAIENGRNLRRHLEVSLNRLSLIYRGIGASWPHKLQAEKHDYDDDSQPLQYPAHPSHARALRFLCQINMKSEKIPSAITPIK